MSFCMMVFSGYMPNSKTAGSHGSSIFSFFKEPLHCSPGFLGGSVVKNLPAMQ